MRINFGRLRQHLNELGAIGRGDGGGISRPAFSEADMQARRWLLHRMAEAGLKAYVDPAGNLIGRLGCLTADRKAVLVGSHIDTVPNGGMFDGAVGVLAGLECLQRIREERLKLHRPLELIAFTDEEGRFGGFFGSYAFTGKLRGESIPALSDSSGLSITEAMARWQMDACQAPGARRDPSEIHAYVELHIEQGPVLEQLGIPVGVVELIVGIRRFGVQIIGRADHAGPTPMRKRKDALLCAVELIQRGHELIEREGTEASRFTVGILQLKPAVANIVPGEAYLTWELRDTSPELLARLADASRKLVAELSTSRGLDTSIETILDVAPVALNGRVRKLIEAAAAEQGLPTCSLPALAGHDAQVLAQVADAGMIFVRSRDGRSHSPLEFTADADIESGANILLATLMALVSPKG